MKRHWSERWWLHLLVGLIMIAGSFFVFWDLSEWEANPDRDMYMPWPAALIYRLGGKWSISGLVLAVGVFLTGSGLHRRRVQTRRPPQPPDIPEGDDC